ncbi:hypothetical protein KC973_03830, partial [Candidatus Saccharibacteria bacterium]|nr:hypothetical protein [Candidatus Saccharibacteria bacterium]
RGNQYKTIVESLSTSFQFIDYQFDTQTNTAQFRYRNKDIEFEECAEFETVADGYNAEALDKALFLAFILIGTSYYKTFPSQSVELGDHAIDAWQARFFNSVYQEGLSQFAFENNLTRENLTTFEPSGSADAAVDGYTAQDAKPLVLQSGGKDSLLLAELLKSKALNFSPWYLTNSDTHPRVLEGIEGELTLARRSLDRENLAKAKQQGGLDGHVPVTYIVLSIALIQAILAGKDTILTAIGHEGEEPYTYISDLPVMHQWAKTWKAEQQFAEYVKTYVAESIHVGSPLRRYSELKIAQLFVEQCWGRYGHEFSSCNIGNYKQGQANDTLTWCGNCAKCANSFLLFAPFVPPQQLADLFGGQNLFKKTSLTKTFKGLLEIDGIAKEFECVGERDELRLAYHMAHKKFDEYTLLFDVPESDFDHDREYPAQSWTERFI